MSMMTSQILKFVDSSVTQKSKYFESETLFFLQIRKSIRDTLDPMEMEENSFLARSSRLQMFFKIGVLENFEIFTGKHLY